MTEITEIVLDSRECTRNIWNLHFKNIGDGERLFLEVEQLIRKSLIHDWITDSKFVEIEDNLYYNDRIVVLPKQSGQSIEVLVPEENTSYINWSRKLLRIDDLSLRFIDFFDFGTSDGQFRDFEFARVVSIATENVYVRPILVKARREVLGKLGRSRYACALADWFRRSLTRLLSAGTRNSVTCAASGH